MPWSRLLIHAAVAAALFGTAACDSTLDTGYVPHKLNGSEADRRSFYAPAFTAQSQDDKGASAPDVGQHGPGRY